MVKAQLIDLALRLGNSDHRQKDRDSGAHRRFTVYADLAAHDLDDFLDDAHAQPRPRNVTRGIGTVKALKDPLQLLWRHAHELVTGKVEAVVGPFTSSMVAVIVPITGQAGIFQISPTTIAMEFLGKDDNLYRINRPTRDNAGDYAKVMHSRGQKRIAVAYDLSIRSFTQSWLDEFRTAAEGLSASVAAEVSYESSKHADFEGVVTKTLQSKPDGLFFFSGALDVARLEQAARQLAL